MNSAATIAYLAAEGHVDALLAELGDDAIEARGRLVLARGPAREAAWAANVWLELQAIPAPSIGAAAKALRAIQRNWALFATGHHRRAALIEAQLPPVKPKPLAFPAPAPRAPLGSWTLWEPDLVYASARCASPFVHGEVAFVEDRTGPPNRAYLKLWEAFTRLGARPQVGERCLDLGAAPGGWSWALARLGARVIAVDKAALDPGVAALANVESRRESAFALDPPAIGPVEWWVSDVVCYPKRLLALIGRWRDSGLARNMIATIKFQGATDPAIARDFAAIPGSRVMHLHHNKHELTWALLRR